MELTEFYELAPDNSAIYFWSLKIFIIALGLCLWAVICVKKSKKVVYNKFDKANSILNKILLAVFSMFSAYGFLDVSDSWFSTSGRPMSASYEYYFYSYLIDYICLALPFVCLISITLAVIFRRKGLRVLSFIVQFLPFSIFIVNNIVYSIMRSLR